MRLQHLHILRPISYATADVIQNSVVRRHIDFGLATQHVPQYDYQKIHQPRPFLLTFETTPTYTCGRREVNSIGEKRIKYLRDGGRAAFYPAMRGGQTTFHGPGQLTAYLIVTLKAHDLTPRCYVRFLENAIIQLCAHYGISACTTSDPGVWLAERTSRGLENKPEPCNTNLIATDSKLCAIGIHMRRGVSSHGIGLNINTDLAWFNRIVACGLVGKNVTSLENAGAENLQIRSVACILSRIIARDLKTVSGIDRAELAG